MAEHEALTARDRGRDALARFGDALAVYLQPRVLIVLFLGFSAGLPLALSGSTLRLWMRQSGVDLETIGLSALIGIPYTIKFLWAPVVDALDVPVFSKLFGRRRGWLLLSQFAMIGAIVLLAFCDPGKLAWYFVFGSALLVATAAATQDILIDAYRIESLSESEQAAGMASYVAAYRVGMLVSTAGCLFLVSGFRELEFELGAAWTLGYLAMAALILVGIVTTLVAPEPEKSAAVEAAEHSAEYVLEQLLDRLSKSNRRFVAKGAILITAWLDARKSWVKRVFATTVSAFYDFLTRDMALLALLFVVLFKFTDAFAGVMTEAFVLDLGFSLAEYAVIIKGVGFAASLLGGFAGGLIARAYPLATSLWIGAILQALANLTFSAQALAGHDPAMLTFAITVENFTSAIGTVIFVAYLSDLCRNPLHTATQYALLTALAALGRTLLSSGAGYVAKATGWFWFFVICVLVALPSLALLAFLQRRGHFRELREKRKSSAR